MIDHLGRGLAHVGPQEAQTARHLDVFAAQHAQVEQHGGQLLRHRRLARSRAAHQLQVEPLQELIGGRALLLARLDGELDFAKLYAKGVDVINP